MENSTFSWWLEILIFHVQLISTFLLEVFYFISRSRPRKELKNNHILITGTGQGIGNLLLKKLARDGNTIHCVDVNDKLNEKVKEEYGSRQDCTVHVYKCDVSDPDSVTKLKESVDENIAAGGHLEYLINNAGIVFGKLFSETPIERYTKVMNVNGLGPMHLTKVFYPDMLEKGGHITNVASIAGLGPCPRMVDYGASKHAVVGFSRGLQYEHDCCGITNVKVTTIFPHLMNTGMFNNCTVKLNRMFPAIEPDHAASKIILAIEEEREEMMIPQNVEKYFIIQYIYGSKMFRRLAKIFGNFEYMKSFQNIREH
ncbi:short-chain dehydrogenase/reductase family 16C member 6-like [Bolinopsis microptera]|uniref:short-chain dehydrogenase/reductase family 16C member 6-like n=1 Tax=Bolinopsis microptera TaxID=2820187 RepID=UPI00307AA937